MAKPNKFTTEQTKTQSPGTNRHIIRTLFASLFGILALSLVLVCILVVWLNQTLTNTTVYVNTVAPLAKQPAIQNFISQKVTDQIMNGSSTQILTSKLLSSNEVIGQNSSQISSEIRAVVNQSVSQIVNSPNFASLWKTANQSASQQLIQELNSKSSNLNLNLHSVVVGVINQLNTTKLAAISSQIQLPNNAGDISVTGGAISKMNTYYHDFKEGTWALLAITLVCLGLCILISVHHAKTIRRILLVIGILSIIFAVILKIPSLILGGNSMGLQQKAALAVFNVLLKNLFLSCLILGIVCIAVSIGSKLYSKFVSKKQNLAT